MPIIDQVATAPCTDPIQEPTLNAEVTYRAVATKINHDHAAEIVCDCECVFRQSS